MDILRPGSVFAGRYAIERPLSHGGMGAVYAVRHVRTGAELALKVMRPEIASDPAMRERFAREARVSAAIQSAHVVTVVDADVDEATGIPFLVMELLRGNDLGAVVRARRPSREEVARWITQTARALDRAHALGIVHRDLKPENLFLASSDGEPERVKILDFGIAKILARASELGQSQYIGTPLYMAPEQMQRGADIGAWTDVWSLGLTAYTLLVGRPYWEGETVHEIYVEILRGSRAASTERAARAGVVLPPAFDAWFARCTDEVAAHRFASAGAAASALAAIAGIVETPAPAGVISQPTPQPAETAPMATEPMSAPRATELATMLEPIAPVKRSWPLAAGALTGVALIAIVVLTLRRSPEPIAETPVPAQGNTPTLRERIEAENPFVASDPGALQRHEVTRGEWAMFLESLDAAKRGGMRPLRGWDRDDPTARRRPVTWITHRQATAFCAALGARLPSGADVKHALAGKTYPWGATLPPPGPVAYDRPSATTLPNVETSSADRTPAGVFDLFGSAREWSSDVEGGFATVHGVALGTPADQAAAVFASPSLKDIEDGDDPTAHVDELADAQLGLRCARR